MQIDSKEALLRLLVQADKSERDPDLCRNQFAVFSLGYFHDDWGEEESDEAAVGDDDATYVEPCPALIRIGDGSSSSLYDALDVLAQHLATSYEDAMSRISTAQRDKVLKRKHPWALDVIDQIRSPHRQLLALWTLGGFVSGPLDIISERYDVAPYLNTAWERFVGSRYVLGLLAAPPHHDEGACILELQPTAKPVDADQQLLAACSDANETAAIKALKNAANPSALDEDGNSALHRAVAQRNLAIVKRLVQAGANVNAQSDYGNAPIFATLSKKGQIGPYAAALDGEDHFALIKELLEHGARVDVRLHDGRSIVDIAAATDPYPEDWIRYLLSKGAKPKLADDEYPLHECAKTIRYRYQDNPRWVLNQARLLLQHGVDPNRTKASGLHNGKTAMHELLHVGYREDELDFAIITDFANLLIAHGAKDIQDAEGHGVGELAEGWVRYGFAHYRPIAEQFRASK